MDPKMVLAPVVAAAHVLVIVACAGLTPTWSPDGSSVALSADAAEDSGQ